MHEPMNLEPPEVVLRFLESVGRRSDAEFYLNLFRADAKERFACICVDAPVVTDALDAVVLDLRFLATLGLSPLVVLGALEPNDSGAHAERICQGLLDYGVTSRVLTAGPDLNRDVSVCMRDGTLPILPMTNMPDLQARLDALEAVVTGLQSRKLIFLQRRGGIRRDGQRVGLVNLNQDLQTLLQSPEMAQNPKQRTILQFAYHLVCERLPHKLTVAITSPLELLRELFTVKGAGTLLRRGGRIDRHDALEGIDAERFKHLLESAFGKLVLDNFFGKQLSHVYLDEDYRAAAVVVDTPLGAYLSKFAVEREAQGEGLGGDLWEQVTAAHPTLFWRARRANPIDPWYVKQCDGMWRLSDWTVYWKGFAAEQLAGAVRFALDQPVDFGDSVA
jgi:bifunctional N-acetylglutamate synthase/kinase